MNSLNLRVSTVKTGENVKKNSDKRSSLIPLPKIYEASDEYYCVGLKNAVSIQEQVSIIKDVFKRLGRELKVLQFLTDLYFHCPLKHAVRNQIMKMLITAVRNNTCGMHDTLIVAALAQSVQHLLEETRNETESAKWNLTVASFTGCFENFECGVKALRCEIKDVFPFLFTALQKYLNEMGSVNSPSIRNDYQLYIHNVVRFMLSCVQEMSTELLKHHNDQLRSLYSICKTIINDDEIPMDPRTNAGILMAQLSKLFNEYGKFIKIAIQTQNPNEIVLCVGVINSIGNDEFVRLSSETRDICDNIVKIANNHSTVPNLLLCATRALYQLSKIILNFTDITAHDTAISDAKLILRRLMMYTLAYLEHHMDSVRNLCRDLLRNILGASKFINFNFLSQKLLSSCNAEHYSISMKCIILQQITFVMGAIEVTNKCPNLFTKLFYKNLGHDHVVNSLYEVLLVSSHKELAYEAWYGLWVEYLLALSTANDIRLPDIESLLVKAVKCEPNVVHKIMEHGNLFIPISTKLSALWAVRKYGLKINNFDDIMQKFSKHLVLSLISNSDETRIMALRLLVETHRTTELLTELECKNLITYLEYNANCQSPSTRQKSLSLLDKALIRLELNMLKSLRAVGEAEARKEVANESIHFPFLREFIRVLMSNLFPGANFSRRSMSLQLLEKCIRLCINCNLMLTDFLPMTKIEAVVDALADSYEANKDLAVRILKLIENEIQESLIESYDLNINVETIFVQLVSIRPMSSTTGAYTLEFFCNMAQSHDFGDFEHVDYEPTYYGAVRWLLANLKMGLTIAEESLLRAAKVNPLYGILFAIRHLLKRLDFKELAKYSLWRITIADLIVLCKQLTIVVGTVVNNSSPEGHLPNDFSAFPDEFLQDSLFSLQINDSKTVTDMPQSSINCYRNFAEKAVSEFDMEQIKTTPQMVLLCAWRTVKEVSLILGDVVLKSPIQENVDSENTDCEFLITKEQIIEIGDHFKELLTETKHRGAFEQAYLGFSKLCCRLWRVDASDLNALPMQWLRDLTHIISSDEQINDKLSATRRSAGVPFMVQALITSELQVGSTKALNYCMTTLLQLCNKTEHTSEARTHALNILRALFRCTDLNEAIGEYICDGIICALRSYKADNWSEKNSATLLFSALIIRIFGVQRNKNAENLSIRNKMTGRIFFLRYAKLYDFLFHEIKIATELVLKEENAPKLPLILLILTRLYPSALEGTESNLMLSSFVPYLLKCSGCNEMYTRKLAAKALAAITATDQLEKVLLNQCAAILIIGGDIKFNLLHGQLLQILKFLKARPIDVNAVAYDIMITLVTIHKHMKTQNPVILASIFDIITELYIRLNKTGIPPKAKPAFNYFMEVEIDLTEASNWFVMLHKSYFFYKLYSLAHMHVVSFLLSPPADMSIETAETSLNVILLILLRANARNYVIDDKLEEFEILSTEFEYVIELDPTTLMYLAKSLRSNKLLSAFLKATLNKSICYPECTMKAYAIYSNLDDIDFTLSQLITEAKKHPADVKSAITMCIKRIIMNKGLDFKSAEQCLEYLLDISQSNNPDCLRSRAVQILGYISPFFEQAIQKKSLYFIRLYTKILLRLLMDDEFQIRDYVAEIVLNNIRTHFEMETVVSTMAQRLFLQDIADLLKISNSDDNFICRVFNTITEEMTIGMASDDNGCDDKSMAGSENSATIELEIFDRNESNAFAEPLKVITDMRIVYERAFKQRPLVMAYISDCFK